MNITNKKIAILGLGIEGIALADFLVGRPASVEVFDEKNEKQLIDNSELAPQIRDVLKNEKIIKTLGCSLDELAVSDYDVIFRSPSVYFNHPKLLEARDKGVEISSQIKLFFELCPCKIIGVTGTKGKGTTATLLFEILKNQVESRKPALSADRSKVESNVFLAGNIGYPAISLIPKLNSEDLVVLELSNFQLADLDKSPNIAVVTNIGIDHLDYHKSYEEYVEAKFNILKHQGSSDYAVLNYNSTFPTEKLNTLSCQKFFFSRDKADAKFSKAFVQPDSKGVNEVILTLESSPSKICDEQEIELVGKHNLENIAAASLAASLLGISIDQIRRAVRNFKGLPYRLELAGEIDGVKFINDSFATNPGPTIAAINSFSQDKIVILGGSSKNADFSELAKEVTINNVKAVISIGVEGPKIIKALNLAGYQGEIIAESGNLTGAVRKAKSIARPGDIVIFSPACASFDMFKNYKDRGAKFKEAVSSLDLWIR